MTTTTAAKAARLRGTPRRPACLRHRQRLRRRLGAAARPARLRGAGDVERRRRRRPRQQGRRALARRGARARARDRRGDRAAGLGRSRERLRRCARGGRRDDPPAPARPASSARRSRTTAATRARRSIRSSSPRRASSPRFAPPATLPFAGFAITARAENFFRGAPDLADTIARLQRLRGGRRRRPVRAGAARPRRGPRRSAPRSPSR